MSSDAAFDPPVGRRRIPTVYYNRPCCWHCGSLELRVDKTENQGDGSIRQHCKCKECKRTQWNVFD